MGTRFLSYSTVLNLHEDQVQMYGGDPGIRDTNLLESAIAMPQSTFGGEFLHPTIPDKAAAYLFHIVKNHPFVDGNKRTGTAAAVVFLEANNHELAVSEDELTNFVQSVAAGEIDKPAVIEFFKDHARRK